LKLGFFPSYQLASWLSCVWERSFSFTVYPYACATSEFFRTDLCGLFLYKNGLLSIFFKLLSLRRDMCRAHMPHREGKCKILNPPTRNKALHSPFIISYLNCLQFGKPITSNWIQIGGNEIVHCTCNEQAEIWHCVLCTVQNILSEESISNEWSKL